MQLSIAVNVHNLIVNNNNLLKYSFYKMLYVTPFFVKESISFVV